MSKRLVLGGLLLAAGGPMLASEAAPLGAIATATAVTLFALPRFDPRRPAY